MLQIQANSQSLQLDINSLSNWSNTWLLPFNPTKYVILHFSPTSDPLQVYYLNNTPLSTTLSHKDLSVTISTDLSWSTHCTNIASQAYKILSLLRRTFNSTNSTYTKKLLSSNLDCHMHPNFGAPARKKTFYILKRSNIMPLNIYLTTIPPTTNPVFNLWNSFCLWCPLKSLLLFKLKKPTRPFQYLFPYQMFLNIIQILQ